MTTDDLPENPAGYDRAETGSGNVKYVSPDRRANIVCKFVSTHGGDIWHCTLYESEEPHGYGKRICSQPALTDDDVADAVAVLHEQRRYR